MRADEESHSTSSRAPRCLSAELRRVRVIGVEPRPTEGALGMLLNVGERIMFLWIESIEDDCIFAETFSVFALLLAFYRGEWSESIVACAAAEIRNRQWPMLQCAMARPMAMPHALRNISTNGEPCAHSSWYDLSKARRVGETLYTAESESSQQSSAAIRSGYGFRTRDREVKRR